MARAHQRCGDGSALLEEEREVGDDGAADGKQDSDLDGGYSGREGRPGARLPSV